jgi:hypothetical protein
MGWWFGRKSAAADARPYGPAWLQNEATEVGFARFYSEEYEEVYRRNPVGQQAVRLVCGMLGSLVNVFSSMLRRRRTGLGRRIALRRSRAAGGGLMNQSRALRLTSNRSPAGPISEMVPER